jgi:hypothetical protein
LIYKISDAEECKLGDKLRKKTFNGRIAGRGDDGTDWVKNEDFFPLPIQ